MHKNIIIELDDCDVLHDASTIINSMDSIRKESLSEGRICKQVEYSTLAYRLAGCIKSLHTQEQDEQISLLEEAIKQNCNLQHYDRLQLGYWSFFEEGVEFVKNLAQYALQFFKPNDFLEFFKKDAEYHLFQALKTLGKETVAPFQMLPLNVVLEQVFIEDSASAKKLAQAYKKCGYASAKIRTKNAGVTAHELLKEGFDAIPENDFVIIKYDLRCLEQFLKTSFGYKKIEQINNKYAAQSDKGVLALNKDGTRISIQGTDLFDSINKVEIGNEPLIEIQNGARYAYVADKLEQKWFDTKLNKQMLAEIIAKNRGEEIATGFMGFDIISKIKTFFEWMTRTKPEVQQEESRIKIQKEYNNYIFCGLSGISEKIKLMGNTITTQDHTEKEFWRFSQDNLFNAAGNGAIEPNMKTMYQMIRACYLLRNDEKLKTDAQDCIAALRKNFDCGLIETSTKITYGANLDAKISSLQTDKTIQTQRLQIPEFESTNEDWTYLVLAREQEESRLGIVEQIPSNAKQFLEELLGCGYEEAGAVFQYAASRKNGLLREVCIAVPTIKNRNASYAAVLGVYANDWFVIDADDFNDLPIHPIIAEAQK